ncbi:MAG: hypothetical protein H0U18_12680 [Pyrinomonadaceae bacterium]|nr:hypothetical protein [Pyrinomonadaceae bacterium]
MGHGNDKNRVHLYGIDYAKWKAAKKHPPQATTDDVTDVGICAQAIDHALHIIEKIIAEAGGSGFLE